MMISVFINIEGMKHVIRIMRSNVLGINVVSNVDGDKMPCAIYSVNVNDSDVSDIACLVAWMDNPHPCSLVRAIPYMVEPMHNRTWIVCP